MHRHVLAFAVALAGPLAAQANPMDGVVSVEILPGWRTEAGTQMAGLHIRLAPGWKTYWRAPGDAGIPPSFDWTGSQNLSGVAFHWPVPEVIRNNGMRSIGYHDDVVIPVELSLGDAGAPARMAGTVQIGVCEEICVPVQLDFDAELPADGARDAMILGALLDRPRTEAEAGVGAVTCAVTPDESGLAIAARIEMAPMGGDEVVVIEAGDDSVWVSEPISRREGGILLADAQMVQVDGKSIALDRRAVRITVLSGGHAVDIQGCEAP